LLSIATPAAAQSPPPLPPPVAPGVAPLPVPVAPSLADPAAPAVPGAPAAVPALPVVPAAPALPLEDDLRQEVLDRPPPTGESLEAFMDRENLDRIIMVAAIVLIGAVALIVTKIQRRRAG
jgi:hypothetical protein